MNYCLISLAFIWWKAECSFPSHALCFEMQKRVTRSLEKDFPVWDPDFRCIERRVFEYLTRDYPRIGG